MTTQAAVAHHTNPASVGLVNNHVYHREELVELLNSYLRWMYTVALGYGQRIFTPMTDGQTIEVIPQNGRRASGISWDIDPENWPIDDPTETEYRVVVR